MDLTTAVRKRAPIVDCFFPQKQNLLSIGELDFQLSFSKNSNKYKNASATPPISINDLPTEIHFIIVRELLLIWNHPQAILTCQLINKRMRSVLLATLKSVQEMEIQGDDASLPCISFKNEFSILCRLT